MLVGDIQLSKFTLFNYRETCQIDGCLMDDGILRSKLLILLKLKVLMHDVSHLMPLHIFYGRSREKLLKFQVNLSFVTLSLILVTTLLCKAMVLQGEI